MWSHNPYQMEKLLFKVTRVISNFCDYIKIGKSIDELRTKKKKVVAMSFWGNLKCLSDRTADFQLKYL